MYVIPSDFRPVITDTLILVAWILCALLIRPTGKRWSVDTSRPHWTAYINVNNSRKTWMSEIDVPAASLETSFHKSSTEQLSNSWQSFVGCCCASTRITDRATVQQFTRLKSFCKVLLCSVKMAYVRISAANTIKQKYNRRRASAPVTAHHTVVKVGSRGARLSDNGVLKYLFPKTKLI